MLRIPTDIIERMVRQASACAPQECCGILSGSAGQVRTLHEMTNADASSEHFMLVPAEQFDVVRRIRSAGERMLAIYHSHPATPARPSQEDIRLALTPGVVHVIVSLADARRPDVRCFDIADGEVREVPVTVHDEEPR